jgi:hypothetical protein
MINFDETIEKLKDDIEALYSKMTTQMNVVDNSKVVTIDYEHEIHMLKTRLLETQDEKAQLITTERNKYNSPSGFDITDHEFADIIHSENTYYNQFKSLLPYFKLDQSK